MDAINFYYAEEKLCSLLLKEKYGVCAGLGTLLGTKHWSIYVATSRKLRKFMERVEKVDPFSKKVQRKTTASASYLI